MSMQSFLYRSRGLAVYAVMAAGLLAAGPVQANNIYLTGHDVLLHSGQSGYDEVILDFLRGVGTMDEIAKADTDIAVVGSGVGSAAFTGGSNFAGSAASGSAIPLVGTLAGYGSATYFKTGTGLDWPDILSRDILIILSHTSCGGCDLSTAGSDEVNSMSAAIEAAFDAGMAIWANSGGSLATYYDFLPPGAVASGEPISGSTGFEATAEGAAIGIVSTMINGFPTHNRFTDIASGFTVFEIRPTAGVDEIISLGASDITFGGIIGPPREFIPVPTMSFWGLALLAGLLLLVAGFAYRRGRV